MKILIDIGHPAHVHYFKNFIKIMKERRHSFLITARDKEISQHLLNAYDIDYVSRGKGGSSFIDKALYLFKGDLILFKQAIRFKPDIFMSFASPYAAQVSKLLGKPHIAFDDTEHAKIEHFMYKPFTNVILNPECFNKNMGSKQIHFNGYMELCYLHPNYFQPNPSILDLLGVRENEKYMIMRFVSWNASHDIGHSGLTLEMKRKAVKELSKYAKVFISSEGEMPEDLQQYQIKIPPERMHDALAFATLFVGEGATMASECACMGTPAIYVNSLDVGYCTEEENLYNLIYGFRNSAGVLEKAMELLNKPDLRTEWQNRRQKMLSDKMDVTAFTVWFVENYPESVKIMKENPDYQYRFKQNGG